MDFEKLNILNGIGWSVIWVLTILILGRSSFPQALLSGLSFFVCWILISIILELFCKFTGYCF